MKTTFASNIKYVPRHTAYADDPTSPLNQLIEYVSTPASQNTWASPEICAEVLFDAVLGQTERTLPTRLNLGAETIPLMRADVDKYLKEMDEWQNETVKVSPTKPAEGERSILDILRR